MNKPLIKYKLFNEMAFIKYEAHGSIKTMPFIQRFIEEQKISNIKKFIEGTNIKILDVGCGRGD